jgi:hypothetical protein
VRALQLRMSISNRPNLSVNRTRGATHPPPGWLDALRIGGRLVFPLTQNEGIGAMLIVTRHTEAYAARAICRAAFIPCIGARDDATSASLTTALERQSLKEIRSLKRNVPPDASASCVGSNWWLSSADAWRLTFRSTGRAGSCFLSAERQRGAPVTFNVRRHNSSHSPELRLACSP